MTITAGAAPAAALPRRHRDWTALHCFLQHQPDRVDALLRDIIGPLLTGLRRDGDLQDWFFIRYAEGGPHLRVRMRGASDATVDTVAAALRQATRPEGADGPADVRFVPYEPETERYGGAAALPVAEEVFCRSTDLALALLAAVPDRARRITVVLDLWAATAGALDLDELQSARWLRGCASIWRWHQIDGLLTTGQIHHAAHAAANRGPAVARRWAAVAAAARAVGGHPDVQLTGQPTGRQPCSPDVLRWARHVHDARSRLESDARNAAVTRERWLGVWASQLHMLCNRLGIVPDEERVTATLAASALEAPDGAVPFFDDDLHAADRRYLVGSRYVGERMDDQTPRAAATPRRLAHPFPPLGPATPLPRPQPLTAGIAQVLATRASGRGDLGGRVTASDVATLVHWAAASSPRPEPHDLGGPRRRPYPSAGAKYACRLRLAARAVDGIAPGLHDIDEDAAGMPLLRHVGPAPTTADLVASSMWLTEGGHGRGRIDAATLPAVLSLHVRLDVLRDAYGQRALRFALLEAGHLAQNLVLVAAALGLAITTVGGFYDDTVHELFMLDGVDDVLAYLLPLGRTP